MHLKMYHLELVKKSKGVEVMDVRNLVLSNIQMDNKLIPLQFSICEKVKNKNFVFVFDEVGCGKTIEAGIVVWDAIKNGENNILIVAPSNLTFNWYNEMLAKFGLDFKIIEGTAEAIDIYFKGNNRAYADFSCDVNKISNLCIVSYDSRNSEKSNAALDRLEKLNIQWDVLILDEGHESKNEKTNRYQVLKKFKSEKVAFLSATPIKNIKKDFEVELELVLSILANSGISANFETNEFSANEVMAFKLNYPISRNFKEILSEANGFKSRIIEDIPYSIDENLSQKIQSTYTGITLDRKKGCIFLYDKIFLNDSVLIEKYKTYKKSNLTKQDLNMLCSFDSKLYALLNQIELIFQNNIEDRIVIFCNHQAVVDYLKKVLICKYDATSIEGIHGDSYSIEERKNRIFLLDKNNTEMDSKKIVILSHNVGSVGVNLSKFNHLINYELPDTPADLEQRFGRIDRITSEKPTLSMYFFADENGIYDEKYFQRIVHKLMQEVLPMLPSKNLLFLSKKTKKLYKELVLSLIELENQLKDFIHSDYKKENFQQLLSVVEINRFFELSGQVLDREKLETYDEGQINGFVENLDKLIVKSKEIIFGNLGIKISTIEEIENKIERFVNNSVSYKDKNQLITLNYEQLKARVFNEEYYAYKKTIDSLDQEIEEIRANLINLYKENQLEAVVEFIAKQNVNDNLIFAVLYSSWKVLNKHNKELPFKNVIEAYNKGGVIHG